VESFDGSGGQHVARSQRTDGCAVTPPYFGYSLFGLRIHSSHILPEISSVQVPIPASDNRGDSSLAGRTVEIKLQASPHDEGLCPPLSEEFNYATQDKDSAGLPALRIWKVNEGQFLRLEYFDGTQFWLDRKGTRVWATWPESLTLADAATYLLGPVLGLLLRLRGVTCLHASAVSFGDCAVAFLGSEGAGKSTTAAALAQQGCAIISDDVVALAEIDGAFYVYPAYPYLCLWPESVETLYGSADALPRFSRSYEKRCLSLERSTLQFETRSLPVKAIYIFGERCSDLAPRLGTISAQKSILALVANTFATNVLETEMRAKEFSTLGRLIPNVRIREVFAHKDLECLPELCRLIREDVEGMNDKVSESPDLAAASQ
jgi:hypothetical protein